MHEVLSKEPELLEVSTFLLDAQDGEIRNKKTSFKFAEHPDFACIPEVIAALKKWNLMKHKVGFSSSKSIKEQKGAESL